MGVLQFDEYTICRIRNKDMHAWIRSFQNDSQQDFHSERDKATTPHLDSEQAPETLLFSDISWEHVRATTLESTLSMYELERQGWLNAVFDCSFI